MNGAEKFWAHTGQWGHTVKTHILRFHFYPPVPELKYFCQFSLSSGIMRWRRKPFWLWLCSGLRRCHCPQGQQMVLSLLRALPSHWSLVTSRLVQSKSSIMSESPALQLANYIPDYIVHTHTHTHTQRKDGRLHFLVMRCTVKTSFVIQWLAVCRQCFGNLKHAYSQYLSVVMT